ncbi:MAG TPA: hypothetical protein VJI67_02775, partial [archaeon]|nr:hypothetical protein [archaeon]
MPRGKANYTDIPSVTFLGYDYSVDLTDLDAGLFTLYSGQQVSLNKGGTFQLTSAANKTYTVKLESVGTASSNVVQATFSVTDGTTSKTQTLQSGSGYDFQFGSDKISVFPTAVTSFGSGDGSVTARIGTGKVTLTTGVAFPFDKQWTVKTVSFSSATAASGYLQFVDLEYGNPTANPSASDYKVQLGQFDGTYNNGLAQGVVLNGPKNQDNSPLFNIKLVGFGSTTDVSTSRLKVSGFSTAPTSVLNLEWTSPNNVKNVFAPTQRSQVDIAKGDMLGDDAVTLTIGTTPWTILGNETWYFRQMTPSGSGSSITYAPSFLVGGPSGGNIQIDAVPVNSSLGT